MIEELKDIGLTENEAKVYLALTELGNTTATPLRNKTGLHNSRVYEALSGLTKKGLVSYFLKNNVKHFAALDPEAMIRILEERRQKLESLIPQIKVLSSNSESDYRVSLYEGYKAVKQVYDQILAGLSDKDEILVLGAAKAESHFLGKTFFLEYTLRRVRKRINMRMIFNNDAIESAKEYAMEKYTKARVLPPGTAMPSAMNIYPDRVSILILKEKPVVFQIDCTEVAKSYRTYFEFMWKISK